MSETTHFLAYHSPTLAAGYYTIKQELKTISNYSNNTVYSQEQDFYVSGDRFSIPPHLVFATFPPKDNEGAYYNVLPHIELSRSTIPWERQANATSNDSKTPWMALLVFNEEETNETTNKPLVQITKLSAAAYKDKHNLPTEPLETAEINQQELQVLKIKKDFFQELMPHETAISLAAHVRVINNENPVTMSNVPHERAFVVAHRLPKTGNNVVHLVSLENRFSNGKFQINEADDTVFLLSLYHWHFNCVPEEIYKLDALALSKLKKNALLDSIDFSKITTINPYLFRKKEKFIDYIKKEKILLTEDQNKKDILLESCQYEAATLHSLLHNLDVAPFQLNTNLIKNNVEIEHYLELGSVPLPHHLRAGGHTISWYRGPFVSKNTTFNYKSNNRIVQHADELILHDETTGLLDISYAASWQLGRILLMNEPKMVQELQLWKLQCKHNELLKDQIQEVPHLQQLISISQTSNFPVNIQTFLIQQMQFGSFPYHYLVPHDDLLPKEALRFFKLDGYWLQSFIEGALSLGETISQEQLDKIIIGIAQDSSIESFHNLYGVLIKSEIVSGWPVFQIEAFCNSETVELLQRNYLSKNVLLFLFNGSFDSLELFMPQEASHFGLDYQIKANSFNNIDMQNLGKTTSSELALNLLQKQDKVRFNISE